MFGNSGLTLKSGTKTPPKYCFVNGRIVTPNRTIGHGFVKTADGIIAGIGAGSPPAEGYRVINLDDDYVLPGFIDLHVHGGGGFDVLDGTVEALQGIARLHATGGTTSLLATSLTSSFPVLQRAIAACQTALDQPSDDGARILGLHLEGPYFAPVQAGAQDPQHIKNPDPLEYRDLLDHSPLIKRMSAAPELPGGLELGRELRQRGVLASIGHSDATFEEVAAALDSGYQMVTHLYSAMSMVKRVNAYRVAGVVEAGLFFDDLTVEIIGDGKHLPASLLKLIYKCKGSDRVTLCTDATRATGLGDGEYIVGSREAGQKAIVDQDVAWMPDRSAFAGSVATTGRLLRNMVNMAAVPLAEAVKLLTVNPARLLGLEQVLGGIDPGKKADLVIMDRDLTVKATIVNGVVVYSRDGFLKEA